MESAVRVWVDSLGGAGAWDRLPEARKQVVLDNLGTALVVDGRPVTTCEQIAKFDFPILLLTGERSPKRYGEMYAAMRKCKNIAEPTVIPNAAHTMHRDNPTAFNVAVLDFLARN